MCRQKLESFYDKSFYMHYEILYFFLWISSLSTSNFHVVRLPEIFGKLSLLSSIHGQTSDFSKVRHLMKTCLTIRKLFEPIDITWNRSSFIGSGICSVATSNIVQFICGSCSITGIILGERMQCNVDIPVPGSYKKGEKTRKKHFISTITVCLSIEVHYTISNLSYIYYPNNPDRRIFLHQADN